MNPIKLLFLIVLLAGCTASTVTVTPDASRQKQDLSPYFKDTVGCFVLYDLKRDEYTRYNETRSPRVALRRSITR